MTCNGVNMRMTHTAPRTRTGSSIAPRFVIGPTRVVARVPELLRLSRGKRVLHLGCADVPYTDQRGDALLHKQLAGVTERDDLWGLDVSAEGVERLRRMGFDHIVCGDVEELRTYAGVPTFDLVLAGELLEHLANPGLFLQSVASIMGERTELILTTPNASSFKGFMRAAFRQEKVHPDHNYYFSYRTLAQILQKFDFTCREIYYYQETEGGGLVRLFDLVCALPTRLSPLWADGLIVRATHVRNAA